MHGDLPQRSPSRPRARLAVVGAALALVLALHTGPRGSRAQAPDAGAPRGPQACTIDGRASFREVRVRQPGRRRRAIASIVPIEDRLVAVQAITPSLFLVRTRVGEPVIEGETREPVPIVLRHDRALSGVLLGRGAPLARLTPRDESVEADVDLGEGVLARHVILSCEALRVRAVEAPAAPTPIAARASPRWRARSGRLSVRQHAEEGVEALLLTVPAGVVLHELGRTEVFVRVAASLPRGRIEAWVRDTDLSPR